MWPHTSVSAKSSPAARAKTRTRHIVHARFRMFELDLRHSLSSPRVQYGFLGERLSERLGRMRAYERFDGIGEMDFSNRIVAPRATLILCASIRISVWLNPSRRLEAIGAKLDEQPQWVVEIDRIHEAAILDAAVLDMAHVETLDGLEEGHPRQPQRQLMHRSDIGRGGGWGRVCDFRR